MIFEIIFMIVFGTMLHFTYEWSHHNKVVAIFSAVNESTWEHIKMGLTPAFICFIVGLFIWGDNPNYFFAKFIGLLAIIGFIPLLHYGYMALTKKHIVIVDILIFIIVIAFSDALAFNIMSYSPMPELFNKLGLIGIIITMGFYLLLTVYPIKNFLFIDPLNSKYGLKAHEHNKH